MAAETEKKAALAAEQLVAVFRQKQLTLALAESCTCGLVSELIGRVSGASGVLWGAFICYTPDAKEKMLDADTAFLKKYGFVSGETAGMMALHALKKSGASVAAAVTGIAGPLGDGGSAPVGTVHTALAFKGGECRGTEHHYKGGRAEVRLQAALSVLEELLSFCGAESPT